MTTYYSNVWNPEKEQTNKWTDVFSNREQQTRKETQAWMENLRDSTINSHISKAWFKSNLTEIQTWLEYERDLHSFVWFLSAIDKLLKEIDDIKDWISKRWQNKNVKELIKIEKEKLNEYKKQLKNKKKALLKQKNVAIYNEDITNFKYLKKQVEDSKKYLYTKLQRWWNFAPEAKNTKEYQSRVEDFEENINNKWNYTQWEYDIYTTNPWIINPSFQRCKIKEVPIVIPNQNISWKWSETIQQTPTDYDNLDRWEAFEKWWISWRIDKWLCFCKNMTPWQRNTWKGLFTLWGVWAWIFWLYKFFTTEKLSRRSKGLITGGSILASQAITWENPISLFMKLLTWWFSKEYLEDKFWTSFWDAINWITNSWTETSNTLSSAMYSIMIFNPSTTVWDIRAMTPSFRDNNTWKTFREDAINKLKNKYGENSAQYFSTTFSDDFDEEKRKNWLASFWITDSTNDSKLIYEYANNSSMNSIILQKFIDENWLKITDNERKKEEYEQYIKSLKEKNQAIEISVLEKHKDDRFSLDNDASYTERPEDIQNKEKFKNQVDKLNLDEQIKTELKKELLVFYDERSIKNKPNPNDFSLEMDDKILILKSNQWEKTKINLQNKTLIWFWSSDTNKYEIKFVRIKDLLNVADLTNNILSMYRVKMIANTPPFQYKPERKWICFNNAETLSFNFDTRVLSTGRGWTTNKIDTLWNHPKEYAQYLSDRWIENLTETDTTSTQQEQTKQKTQ